MAKYGIILTRNEFYKIADISFGYDIFKDAIIGITLGWIKKNKNSKKKYYVIDDEN